MGKPTVAVLVCTYNGEKYIREQLDSLLAQTYENIRICVRDDGSSDATTDILSGYFEAYPDKVIMILKTPAMSGYPNCFWDLMRQAPMADYYAYCDQDDVWAPDKIERAVTALEGINSGKALDPEVQVCGANAACPGPMTEGAPLKDESSADEESSGRPYPDRPLVYFHDYENTAEDLTRLSLHTCEDFMGLQDQRLMFYCIAQGFSHVVNRALLDKVLSMDPERAGVPHDMASLWTAWFYGKIVHDTRILAKYRRHQAAVTESGTGILPKISNWLRQEIFSDYMTKMRSWTLWFADHNQETMGDAANRRWRMLSLEHKNPAAYVSRLLYPGRLSPWLAGEIALRIDFLLGK